MSDPLILTVPLFSDLGNLGLALRRSVFVGEQHVPPEEEFDSYDLTATHVVALLDGSVVGCLRILFLAEHVKFGRVVVAATARGQGIASRMMRYAMDLAAARGQTRFYLTAQSDKLALYEKLGFVAFGEEFQDGGMPHFAMKTY
ncbi:MAG: GNAT family N-acetyltransferase [Hyphomicrobiales bacterium]|nr:MAG: GNAT family N-acetyltransferase [Hyphomicrobiales bacterium]